MESAACGSSRASAAGLGTLIRRGGIRVTVRVPHRALTRSDPPALSLRSARRRATSSTRKDMVTARGRGPRRSGSRVRRGCQWKSSPEDCSSALVRSKILIRTDELGTRWQVGDVSVVCCDGISQGWKTTVYSRVNSPDIQLEPVDQSGRFWAIGSTPFESLAIFPNRRPSIH